MKQILAIILLIIGLSNCNQPSSNKRDELSFDAEKDIKNGEIQLLTVGLLFPLPPDTFNISKKLDSLELRYGFKWQGVGCTPPDEEGLKQMREYNDKVVEYLSIRNGKDWYKRYSRSADSLHNLYSKVTGDKNTPTSK